MRNIDMDYGTGYTSKRVYLVTWKDGNKVGKQTCRGYSSSDAITDFIGDSKTMKVTNIKWYRNGIE